MDIPGDPAFIKIQEFLYMVEGIHQIIFTINNYSGQDQMVHQAAVHFISKACLHLMSGP